MADEADPLDDTADKPSKRSKSAKGWLDLIAQAEKAFSAWQDKADGIEKLYADLEKLSGIGRDREFQLFWANIQVLGPSIYSRAPVPVVVPRFKDRRPLPRTASELLERCAIVQFELEDIDSVMRLARDDLNIVARGALWARYVEKDGEDSETVCVEHVDRRDFLHDPARKWKEVDWVARRSWLTKEAARKRFAKTSGDAYKTLAYGKPKDRDGADDGRMKAAVWELWSKSQDLVVWVSEGCDVVLDQDKPHLKLQDFFPCPRPAYATTKPRTLQPIPDALFYKDQLEEINEATARIAALTEALRVAGFYPAGSGEIADAVEAAMASTDSRVKLIPISNWAALGGSGAKDMVIWWPIADVAKVVSELVAIRKQLIEDVYQIMGLSDIMRGSTEASETLGAQQLKSQYGSVRIRDKQSELVRIARDLTRIVAEIMAENFKGKTLLDMSQLEIPTDAEIAKQVAPLEKMARQITAELRQAETDPRLVEAAQKNAEAAQQILQEAQQRLQGIGQQIEKLKETVTIEKVVDFLRDQRLRPFVLDIETDSTIAPDENAAKQRATEFVTAVGGAMNQAAPLLMQLPQAGPLLAETLKYLASQYRAGRQLEQEIETFADGLKQQAGQPKPPDPAQAKAEADAKATADAAAIEQQRAAAELQDKEVERAERVAALRERQAEEAARDAMRQREIANKDREAGIKHQALIDAGDMAARKHAQDMDIGALQLDKLRLEIGRVQTQTAATIATTDANIAATEAKTDANLEAQAAGLVMKQDAAALTAIEP